MNLLRNQGQSQRDYIQMGRCWLALVGLGGFLAGSPLHAATIQLDITLAVGTAIHSSSGSAATGTAYVGSFFNGSSAMSKTSVAALWNNTRAGFNNLWSAFVPVASASVNSGGFSISTSAEVENLGGKNMVGKNIYVLVVDNASSPNGFLLLAADGSGSFEAFADPNDVFGDGVTSLEISGEPLTQVDPETGGEYIVPASTTVVGTSGSYNTSSNRWTMASIPGGSAPATPTLKLLTMGTPVYTNGNTVITHTFAGNTNATYVFEYKSSLASAWQTNPASVNSSTNFSVTFTNVGVNSTNDWKNRMFFRVKNG